MKIKSVKGLQIFDSRGNPTVKAFVELSDRVVCFRSGAFGRVYRAIRGL